MASDRPDLHKPTGPPPSDRAAGPSGVAAVLPAIGLILLAVVIIALVLFGGWLAFAFALLLLLAGVIALIRYVQRVAWTRSSARNLRRGVRGMNEDLAISDEAHADLSPHDLPLDSAARKQVASRRPQEDEDRSPPAPRPLHR